MAVAVNRWAGITYPLWSPPVPVLNEGSENPRNTFYYPLTGLVEAWA